jgi:hypothetical protein
MNFNFSSVGGGGGFKGQLKKLDTMETAEVTKKYPKSCSRQVFNLKLV